jgi:hypothetical protein
MSKRNTIRIILSLLALSLGVLVIIGSLKPDVPNYVFTGMGLP